MNRLTRKEAVFLWAALMVGFSFASIARARPGPTHRVFILSSYHQGYSWADEEYRGIRDAFDRSGHSIDLYVEYMDSKRFKGNGRFPLLRDQYDHKYKGVNFDVAICADDNAFLFMQSYHKELFPDVPVVFCGVNYFDPDSLRDPENFTGVVEWFDVLETVHVARKQNPGANHLVLISDRTPTGRAVTRKVEEELNGLSPPLRLTVLDSLTLNELSDYVSTLDRSSLVLYSIDFRDRFGTYYDELEVIEPLAQASGAPVYGLWDRYLGHGIVGGKLNSGYDQGSTAAVKAVALIEGAGVGDLPIQMKSINRYMFDADQLRKWNIPDRLVPEGSVVINRHLPWYRTHLRFVFALLFFLLVETVILVLLARNIINRRIAERRHLASETKYRLLFEAELDALFVIDPVRGTILEANPAAERMYGWTLEEMRSMRFREFADRPRDLLPLFSEPSVALPVHRHRRRNGDLFPVEIVANRVPWEEGSALMLAVRDVSEREHLESERKRWEQRVQQAQKMESLGVLAGGIAHDFNNLLVGVMGNAGLALMELPPDSPVRQTVKKIEVAAKRAAELTHQMLAYAGKGRFLVEPANLSKIVEEIVHLIQAAISKRATLDLHLDPNLPFIMGDATQLRQVVMNLVINASEALGDDNGTITVTTSVLDTNHEYMRDTYLDDELTPGRYVILEVSDTGCGMDAPTLKRIFDPFYSTKFSGRGLGLAATMGIVRSHNGTLKVTSEAGEGSTFRILFPAMRSVVRKAPADLHGSSEEKGEGTVLVVDDEEQVRIVANKILLRKGYHVILAADGPEALELFAEWKESISAVLLDLTLPHLGGEEVLHAIRQLNPGVPVILMTGYSEQEVMSHFADLNLAGFLQKPFTPSQLLDRIGEALK